MKENTIIVTKQPCPKIKTTDGKSPLSKKAGVRVPFVF